MKIVSALICALLVMANLQAHVREELKRKEEPAQEGKGVTYFTDDGRYAVHLTNNEVRTIQKILKTHTWADQDYNKLINKSFIQRIIGGCESANQDLDSKKRSKKRWHRGQQCSPDAELIKMVLTDFKGRSVQDLFTALGLRREI